MFSLTLRNSFHNKKASQDKGSNGTHMPFLIPFLMNFDFFPKASMLLDGFEFDY